MRSNSAIHISRVKTIHTLSSDWPTVLRPSNLTTHVRIFERSEALADYSESISHQEV